MQETDLDKIMSDRNLFNEFVYTPLSEALKILEERRKDKDLVKKIEELLKGDIPEILNSNKCAILGRHIATPNFENRMFVKISKEYNLRPVFFEYLKDKFVSKNDFKLSLGQLRINDGYNRNGDRTIHKVSIIDFHENDGKAISEINTLWGTSLVQFHRDLNTVYKLDLTEVAFYDLSDWIMRHGGKATNFYKDLLLLFVCHGILFENFLVENDPSSFSKKIVIPAIENIKKITGCEPLIVPIPPMDIEEDDQWFSHESIIKDLIK